MPSAPEPSARHRRRTGAEGSEPRHNDVIHATSRRVRDAWAPRRATAGPAGTTGDDVPPGGSAETDVAPAGEPAGPGPVGSYRPELQGLRAVAIAMVVCYHIWFDRVSGGVDIFLLISAFLLTGSFARRLERGRPMGVPDYWLHAFKRLVPPGALVILLTVGASLLILPATRWFDLFTDAIASLTYWENWLLASRSVDYYAADHATASPLQHFWSLSVQGQVFLLWPLLFLVAAILVRRLRLPARATLLVIFGAVTIASFAWSVHLTSTDQAFAYFDTRTRLWEFSLGSVLALVLPLLERRLRFRQHDQPSREAWRTTRGVLGWAGMILILACGWLVDVQGAFPGWIALWPLLAACLVIAAGPTGLTWGVDRLLASRPLQWLGDQSYALYLVHWPLLILALSALDVPALGPVIGVLLVAAAVVLAWLVTRFVDAPIRYSRVLDRSRWRSGLVIVVSCALVLVTVTGIRGGLQAHQASIEAESARNNPGARSLQPGFVSEADADAPPLPDLAQLQSDWFEFDGPCSGPFAPAGEEAEIGATCTQEGSGRGDTLVIIGDSRDQQLSPSIVETARSQGWTVVTIFVGGCPFSTGEGVEAWCDEHNQRVAQYLARTHPSAVMSSSTRVDHEFRETVMPGYEELTGPLLREGTDVIGTRDIPRLFGNPVECLEEGRSTPESCPFPIPEEYRTDPPADLPESGTSPGAGRFYAVDLSEDICPGRVCVPEIGNVYVWMDAAHISSRYAATLAPAMQTQLSSLGWSWDR